MTRTLAVALGWVGKGARELRVGLVVLALIIVASVAVPVLSPYGVNELVGLPYEAPSLAHPFGTDNFGRDVVTRTFAAGRVDLTIAVIGSGLSLFLGTVLGVTAGVARWRGVDAVLMRSVDGILAIPFVVLVLSFIVVIGPGAELPLLPAGLPALLLAIVLVNWTIYARLARARALVVNQQEYVTAGRLLGIPETRLLRRHVWPNVFGTTATYFAGDAILIIVLTASLAFLGAGVQPPTPEWGNMMYEGRTALATAPWISIAPGAVLAATGLGLTLVADAVSGDDG